MIRYVYAILAGGVLLACNLAPTRLAGPEVDPLPPPQRTAYAIRLVYSSELNDPYYVMSGPDKSYGRYSITKQFQELIQDQVTQLSDPASARSVTLTVHLTELTTRYRQLGGSQPPAAAEDTRYAMLGTDQLVVPASWQMGPGSHLLASEISVDIPAEIRKGATLVAIVELAGEGVTPLRQTLNAKHDDVMTRWDFDPSSAYSYTDILDKTLRVAAGQITEVVVAHLK